MLLITERRRRSWCRALRCLLWAAAVVLPLGAVLSSATVRPALACSPVPGFDLVRDSDLIVAGRLLSWERPPESSGSMTARRLRMTVDRTFKGVAPAAELTFIDPNALAGAAACGLFTTDPSGQYAVLGLFRDADGTYHANLFSVFARGAEPGSPGYEAGISRLVSTAEAALDLADPRPCIPATPDRTPCSPARQALWDGDAAAWAARGVTDPAARFVEILSLRVRAGDPATIANIARVLGQPYLKVTRVRFTGAEFVEVTNLGGGAQDLSGWTVRAPERGLRFSLPAGVRLAPGQSCWVYSTADSTIITRNSTDQCRAVTGAPTGTPMGPAELDVWPNDAGRVVLYYDAVDLPGDDTRYSSNPGNQPPPPHLHLVGARP